MANYAQSHFSFYSLRSDQNLFFLSFVLSFVLCLSINHIKLLYIEGEISPLRDSVLVCLTPKKQAVSCVCLCVTAHTPDNSFLGFVVEQHLNASDIKHIDDIKRQNQSLVYGKVDNFWKVPWSFMHSHTFRILLTHWTHFYVLHHVHLTFKL